ncbi:glycoside hydrolase family 16 protein [Backusella circina FSU 941]|nr:glycoside hydrolase family 16 protein [Backusella circina FSU 941]
MFIPKLSLLALATLAVTQTCVSASQCTPFTTDFTKGSAPGWSEITGKGGDSFASDGLELSVTAPKQYVKMTDPTQDNLPYNKYTSNTNPNYAYKTPIQFGKVSYVVKSSPGTGVVTAPILISSEGDEIDFEMLGADPSHVQTNYFYGDKPVYGVNGGNHAVSSTTDGFHTYTIDWSPERIVFSFDGKVLRTQTKEATCKGSECSYPYHPL